MDVTVCECVCVCVCVYARARACVRLCAYARVKRCVRFGMQAQDVLVVNCDFIFDVCGCVDVCVCVRARACGLVCCARVCKTSVVVCGRRREWEMGLGQRREYVRMSPCISM